MRTLWLCLLIALMPLRLWAGSAMAVQHLETPTAVPIEVTQATPGHPCHGEASAVAPVLDPVPMPPGHDHAAHAAWPAHGESASHHASCMACEICHTVAHPLGLDWGAMPPLAQAAPDHRPHAAISPQLARSVKPPIA